MKLKELLNTYWEVFFSFMNALVIAYDGAVRLLQLGWITNEKLSDICTLLFLFFGCLGIWKFVKKAREAERLLHKAEERVQREFENARESDRLYKELQIAYANQGKQREETTFPKTF